MMNTSPPLDPATGEPLLRIDRPLPGCVQVTLNRPRAMNALSRALRTALVDTFTRLATDPQARIVILTGAGPAFCAGLDLKELGSGQGASPLGSDDGSLDIVAAIGAFPGPVIGAINGVAITGGFELALCCDVLIASSNARFADTHARVGVIPGWGLSQKLSRVIGLYRAKELSLTGNFLDARTAADWGLVNRVVDADRLLPEALSCAEAMLSVIPEMLVRYKRLIDDGFAQDFGQAMRTEREASREWASRIDRADIERRREAVRARGREQQAPGGADR